MDEQAKRAYVITRLARADDDLLTAGDDLANGHTRGATNRAYYAVFHAASAALLWVGVERAKHAGTQSAFGESLVRTGLIEPDFGRVYSRARKAREEQDYDLQALPLSESEAQQIVTDAERFVKRVKSYLSEAGALS
jgi:uncharacterized protein (UPF0332 family)